MRYYKITHNLVSSGGSFRSISKPSFTGAILAIMLVILGGFVISTFATIGANSGPQNSQASNLPSSSSSDALANSAWPMYQHDLQHTGQSPYNGPAIANLKWKFNTTGVMSAYAAGSTPVVGHGTIYYSGFNGILYAINPDGRLKWEFVTGARILSTPAIGNDGSIYFGSDDGNIYAINSHGSLEWKLSTPVVFSGTGNSVVSSPAIATDGTIYVGGMNGIFYAINPDGTIKWTYATNWYIRSSPSIAPDGTIYVGMCDAYNSPTTCESSNYAYSLYAFKPDGTLKWTYQTPYSIDTSPAVATDGTIYVASYSLYAINPDGSLKWIAHTTPSSSGKLDISPAIGPDGSIYSGDNGGVLYAFSAAGTQEWEFRTSTAVSPTCTGGGSFEWPAAPIVDAQGNIYVGNEGGCFISLSPNGSLRWAFQLSSGISTSSSVASDGTLYVGSDDGFLYAFSRSSSISIPTPQFPVGAVLAVLTPFAALIGYAKLRKTWVKQYNLA